MGRFKNEKQYADYFEKLLIEEKINYIREYRFKEILLSKTRIRCIVDFIIENIIIIEFKAKNFIVKEDYLQTQRYLRTLNLELGILMNFRQYRLAPKRVLNSDYEHSGHSENNS